MSGRIFLLLGILLLFYRDPSRGYTTFAILSTLCNSKAFLSACSVEDHSNPLTLDSLNPLKIINSFGDDSTVDSLVKSITDG